MSNRPLTEREMLEQEYEAIHGPLPEKYVEQRRKLFCECDRTRPQDVPSSESAPPQRGCGDAVVPQRETCDETLRQELISHIHHNHKDRAALCLSGGGIRSAAFGLGVLQAMAKRGLLKRFDYLSTVSGGGYIGAWLTAWMHREGGGIDDVARKLAESVGSRSLTPAGAAGNGEKAKTPHRSIQLDEECARRSPEPTQVQHLRDYSNYLTPRMGIFRADSWTLVATYLRNLLLNWLILVPLLAGLLLLPRLFLMLLTTGRRGPIHFGDNTYWIGALVAIILSMTGVVLAVVSLPSLRRPAGERPRGRSTPRFAANDAPRLRERMGQAGVFWVVLMPIIASSVLTAVLRAWLNSDTGVPFRDMLIQILIACAVVYSSSAIIACLIVRLRKMPNPPGWISTTLGLTIAGTIVGLLVLVTRRGWLLTPGDVADGKLQPYVYATFLVPVFILQYLLLTTLYVGLTSNRPGGDEDREWWARLMGLGLMFAVGWIVLFAIALLGPQLVEFYTSRPWKKVVTVVSAIAGFATALGLFGARSQLSGARETPVAANWPTRLLDAVPDLAARVALLGILVLIAIGLEFLLTRLDIWYNGVPNRGSARWRPLCLEPAIVWGVFGALFLLAGLAGRFINSNRLSLHAVYRDRLIRAFLGASHAQRKADPFTGFDPADNMPMHHLRRQQYFSQADLAGDVEVNAGAGGAPDDAQHSWTRPRAHAVAKWLRANKRLQNHIFAGASAEHQNIIDRSNLQDPQLRDAIVKTLNNALCDPYLIWESRFKDEDERKRCPQVDWAFQRLESDGCPHLLNRLILEEECYLEVSPPASTSTPHASDAQPGCASQPCDGDSRDKTPPQAQPIRTYLLKAPPDKPPVPKPLHVTNLALNLVHGRRLAWQQRKAASFTVSPLHSGFANGYRPSVLYGGGITLGTAVTISGAAASPNMGYHSSPAVTFLMALFNVRLGWWLGNPARVRPGLTRRFMRWLGIDLASNPHKQQPFERGDPRHTLLPLIDEALGRTNDQNGYLYLSDGGHFENLGVYEMVRRRCRYIVVSDASCDPNCNFEDLANAVRKVYIDMGIPIVMHEVLFHPKTQLMRDGKHCAIGFIKYGAVDVTADGKQPAPPGFLIYLKPARHENMAVDLYSHGQSHEHFPHEPTANQWFTESQFESYRKLGFDTVDAVCQWRGQGELTLEDLKQAAEDEARGFKQDIHWSVSHDRAVHRIVQDTTNWEYAHKNEAAVVGTYVALTSAQPIGFTEPTLRGDMQSTKVGAPTTQADTPAHPTDSAPIHAPTIAPIDLPPTNNSAEHLSPM